MGHRTTYYTDGEEQALEQLAEEQDESYSKLVRNAIQQVYDL